MPDDASMHQAISAAQDLVRLFNNNPNTPPQSHSVYVKTIVNDKKEFVYEICASEHPQWKGKLNIPAEHLGVPVTRVEWPVGQR